MTSKLSHKKILDRSGRTPVARACANDNIEQLAAELKERPHHLNEPDYARNTPLQIAALEGFVEPVRHLINEGCTVNCKNIDGDTPLIDAVENGHLQVVDILLEAGADPRMRNGKGFEPLDLVNTESDDYEAIRDSLTAAKSKFSLRRQSEDQSTGAKDNDGASISAPGGSPTDSLQTQGSKPGSGGDTVAKGHSAKWEVDVGRRKTARREPTREDLLWITGTPARLKDAASKGDMEVVNACLNTLRADTESMLAAARGGHDDVLGLMIALGKPPEPDPEPLSSNEYRPGHDTPMLAAIGGGNVKVIKVLLGQPMFNPTRRMYHGLTYYELAKQRQSSNWQEEHDVLKEAYDKYSSDGARKSASSSPHKVRTKRPDSSSPLASSTSERPVGRIKRESSHKSSSYKHLHPNDTERKGSSSAVSDREAEGVDARKPKVRNGRSVSDAGSTANARSEPGTKPRRRLLSKNEIQSDQDIKRKASVAVEKSPPLSHASHEKSNRVSTDSPVAVPQDKKASPQDSSFKRESGKKRPRISTSPRSNLSEVHKDHDAVKKKRQRADSQGNAIEQERKDSLPRGPAMVANMIVSPEPVMSPIKTPGTAPVAFMGGSTSSPPMVRSPIEQRKSINFPLGSLDVALQQDVAMPENLSFRHDAPILQPPGQATEHLASTSELSQKSEDSVPEGLQGQNMSSGIAEEHELDEKAARDIEILKARGREARAARELEEAHLKAKREETELQRQMQTEREEAEARAAKERNDGQQMQMGRSSPPTTEDNDADYKAECRAYARRVIAEVLARPPPIFKEPATPRSPRTVLTDDVGPHSDGVASRDNRDELLAAERNMRRRAEQERQQKEKEDRRLAELELRGEQRRIRLQEEQEMQRRERLTCGLRRAAEISPDEARHPGWIQNWLPLYYVTSEDLDPECDKDDINERWISNVQVAPLLANRDLELSQCRLCHVGSSRTPLTAITDTAWTHRPLTLDQRGSLWRQLRNQQSGIRIPELRKEKGDSVLYAESKRSFFTTLESIFWLRYSDFLNIIPRHPHLAGIPLASRHMALHDYPFGIGGTWDKETPDGKMSVGQKRGREEEEAPAKRSANGDLPNGHI